MQRHHPQVSPDGAMHTAEVASAPQQVRRDRFGLELTLVLGVSLGYSAVYALLQLIDFETRPGGVAKQTATVVAQQSSRAWLDFLYQSAGIALDLIPALLAMLLLSRSPALPGFGIGIDRTRVRLEFLQGLGFAAVIGIPGVFLVIAAEKLGFNAQIVATNLADTWWRYPMLTLAAIQNGILEEVVVVGYLLTRLRQLSWPPWKAIAVSAALRGSYHLYQGYGGFFGNAVMGAIFAWWFVRTRRVLPLVIAHSVLDIASFVGYAALHGKVSWI